MKKTFTILIAAIAAILIMAQPKMVVGQTKTDPTFTFTQNSNAYGWSGTPANSTDLAVNDVFTNGDITFTYTAKGSGSTNLRWWSTTDGLRSYSGNRFKIATSNGTIESIAFTGSCVLTEYSSTGGSISSQTWSQPQSGGVTAVEFTCSQTSGNKTIKTVTVTIATGGGGGGTTYTVTYNANDGSQTPATFAHSGQSAGNYTVLANNPESNENPSFTRTGYDFSTWNEAANGSGTGHAANSTFNLTGAITLYAIWAPHTHNITMPSNAYGTYSAASNAASGDYEYGSTITLTYDPAEGYNGYSAIWSINDTPIVGNTFTMPDTDVIVTAEVAVFVDDVLDRAKTGVTNGSTTYTSWSGKTSNSQAVYAGKTAGNYNSIQMNNTTGNGIITTASGGKVKSISVDWNTNTTSGRYITIYGSNTAFTSINMSSASSLGTIKMGTNTSLAITSDYEYIGIVANGALYLNSINIKWKPSTVATPTFDPDGEAYIGTQHVTIGCTTTGATIYYTTNGSLPTKDAEGTYTYVNNTTVDIATTTTLKARAYKEGEYSALKSAAYTITQPFTTMQAIYDDAMTNTAEHTVYITFGNNWVISGANNSSHAFLTDGTKGCIIYASSHGFSAGDILSGTVQCKSQKYNGAVELTELKSNTSGLTVNTGGNVTVADIAMADLEAVNTGALVSYSNLTCSKETSGNYTNYNLTDGTTTVQAYKTLLDNYADYLSNGKTYDITGVFVLNNSTLRINPRTSADIVLKADMSLTDFSGLTAFSYVVNNGPSAAQHIEVLCDDLGTNTLRATAPQGYEVCSTENGTYAQYIDLTPSQGAVAADLYIRLAAGHNEGTYNGNLSFTATTLDAVNVPLQGSVSTVATYAISLVQTTGGTIAADKSVASEGTTVTLSYSDLDDCYDFTSWTVYKTGDQSTTENVDENGQFKMPGYPVTATATFTQKKFTVNYSVNGIIESDLVHANITCGNNASLWDEDDLEAASVELPSGFSLAGWSTSAGSTVIVDSFTPDDDATLYAVLVPAGTGYQLITSTSQITAGKYLFAALRATTLPEAIEYSIATGSISSGDIVVTSDKHAPNTNNIYTTVPSGGVEFELSGNNSDGFTICYDSKYLGYTSATSSRALAFDKDYSTILWKFYALDNGLSTGALYMQNYQNNKYYTVSENSTGTGAIRGYAGETKYRGFYLFKKIEAVPYTHVYTGNNSATADITIEGPTLIAKDAVLDMGSHALSIADGGTLIIEDGGQLILKNNNTVKATVKKTTAASSTEKAVANNLYAIASPVNDILISSFAQGTHNVYRFDEPTSYWNEYRSNNTVAPYLDSFTKLAIGRGYLYRSSVEGIDLAGDVTGGNASGEISNTDLSYAYGIAAYKGLNLVGNPFTHDISWSNLTLSNVETTGCYMLVEDPADNDHGKWKAVLAANVTVKPMQAFFVQTTNETASITFKNTAGSSKGVNYAKDNIMFSVKNSKCSDEAYVMFAEGHGLNKIEHRNSEIPMLYIINNGQNYAIADMSDDTEVINIGFEAKTMGQYTFSIKTEGQYSYMSLYDKVANLDVDMLLEDSYTFVGTPNDRKDRFVLRLNYNAANIDTESDVFAYQNGNDIIVRGNGELQIFDVMGRFVTSEYINGVQSFNADALSKGVYVLRIVGTEIKTQKIVVR